MNPDPLAGLRDWHLPEPISWWPPAPGWWLLAVAGVIGVLLLVHWLWRRYRRAAVARTARRELASLERALATTQGDARSYIADLSRLLRRLALVRYPREQVAGLSGRAWLEFLDATGGEGGFTQDAGRMLVEDAYRPETQPLDAHALEQLGRVAARWIAANREVRP